MKNMKIGAGIATVAFLAGGAAAVATRAVEMQPHLLAQPAAAVTAAKKPLPVKSASPTAKPQARQMPRVVTAFSGGPSSAGDDRYHGVKLGTNASLGGWRPFPDDNYWNTPIDHIPVDDNSKAYISSIGYDKNLHPDFGPEYQGSFIGIPYIVVSGSTPRSPVMFQYADESDHELYPIPPNPPIEGYPNPHPEGDRHLLVLDRDNWRLFELMALRKQGKRWTALSGAVYDLNAHPNRPRGWTSADAAGLPIFPALVKWEEVHVQKEIRHALRFTAPQTQRAYAPPASHYASRNTDPTLPPMGIRVRLKSSYDIAGFSPECQVILKALKKYGMILADNGKPFFVQGAPDPRWKTDTLAELKRVKGADLEVVQVAQIFK